MPSIMHAMGIYTGLAWCHGGSQLCLFVCLFVLSHPYSEEPEDYRELLGHVCSTWFGSGRNPMVITSWKVRKQNRHFSEFQLYLDYVCCWCTTKWWEKTIASATKWVRWNLDVVDPNLDQISHCLWLLLKMFAQHSLAVCWLNAWLPTL